MNAFDPSTFLCATTNRPQASELAFEQIVCQQAGQLHPAFRRNQDSDGTVKVLMLLFGILPQKVPSAASFGKILVPMYVE